jgi:hypothetical protein
VPTPTGGLHIGDDNSTVHGATYSQRGGDVVGRLNFRVVMPLGTERP